MAFTTAFYTKLGLVSLAVGAAMEGFMIKTGFYDKVTALEAERMEDNRVQREEFQQMLRQEILRQAKDKKLDLNLPPDP